MKEKLEKELIQLQESLKKKYITVNEYCDRYYQIAQKLKTI